MVEPLKKDSNNDMEKKNEVKNEIDNVRLALSKQSLGDEMDVQSQSQKLLESTPGPWMPPALSSSLDRVEGLWKIQPWLCELNQYKVR